MKQLFAILAALAMLVSIPAVSTAQDATLTPRAKIVTSEGDIVIELDGEKAPISVANFVTYAEEDFYDGTIFHRVIDGFMVQGGGFTPGMNKRSEGMHAPIKNEWTNGLKNTRGTLAMARLGQRPNSATSQFFINVADNSFLDQPRDGAGYAVFAKVVEGMDVVDKIKGVETTQVGQHGDVPVEPIIIEDVVLLDDFAKDQAMENVDRPLKNMIKKLENENGKEFETTDSGLMVMHVREGEGEHPKPTDQVEVHYRGTLLDGTEFDSSYKRGQTITFPLNRVIAGWTEGVGMMKPGGKSILVIPGDLAYGSNPPPGSGIPVDGTLVFEVELVSIK